MYWLGKYNQRIEIKYKNLLKENNEKDKIIEAYQKKLNEIEKELQSSNLLQKQLSNKNIDYETLQKRTEKRIT